MHRHRPQGEPTIRPYTGPIRDARGRENPRAHGNIRETARCGCGAVRERNLNGSHVESSGWIEREEG